MDSRYKLVTCHATDEMQKAYSESELATWPQPKDITRTDFHSGMLGMCEMESAAARIVEIAKGSGHWGPVSLEHMKDEHERTGFIELVYNNLLVKYVGHWYYYNGTFIPSRRLVDILAGKKPNQPRIDAEPPCEHSGFQRLCSCGGPKYGVLGAGNQVVWTCPRCEPAKFSHEFLSCVECGGKLDVILERAYRCLRCDGANRGSYR